ncbi:MAG: hypothetical protein KY475_19910 [Planctomycetes bacterium]|nr:hypothetical protein [Planctomycetota bacterium]
MKPTAAWEDALRIYTAEGERRIPVSQVRSVLRKTPRLEAMGESRFTHFFATPPAVGIELRSGEIIWSDGETDWYYSGEPARVAR